MTLTPLELQDIAQIPQLRNDIGLLAKAIHELYEKAKERGAEYAARLARIEEYMAKTADTWQRTYETAQEIKKSRTGRRALKTTVKAIGERRQ